MIIEIGKGIINFMSWWITFILGTLVLAAMAFFVADVVCIHMAGIMLINIIIYPSTGKYIKQIDPEFLEDDYPVSVFKAFKTVWYFTCYRPFKGDTE